MKNKFLVFSFVLVTIAILIIIGASIFSYSNRAIGEGDSVVAFPLRSIVVVGFTSILSIPLLVGSLILSRRSLKELKNQTGNERLLSLVIYILSIVLLVLIVICAILVGIVAMLWPKNF